MNQVRKNTVVQSAVALKAHGAEFAHSRHRFSSNIAGPIILIGDLLCLLLSIPISLFAYWTVIGLNIATSVHVFALCATGATFILLRSSRRSYRQSFVSLLDHGDPIMDALASVLIASALVWQFGLIENLSRGVTIFYAGALVLTLIVTRPLIHATLRGLARRSTLGAIPE